MMTNPDDTTDVPRHPETGIPICGFGDAEVTLGFDEETYATLRDEYERAVAGGYNDPFSTFAYNHCRTRWSVTVEGQAVDVDTE